VVTLDLPPEPRSATRARQVTREQLAASCPQDSVEVAALLVTELVSNAVLHARTDIVLSVEVSPGCVVLRVRDGSDIEPVLRTYGPQAATGRGIALVEQLASAWGVDHSEQGKEVWCRIDFSAATDGDIEPSEATS
jgi:anti-sigma regulatory factor (Ser/Thr protein kinase)